LGSPARRRGAASLQDSVLELLNEGLSFSIIIQDYYPDLQIEDIRACLQYAIALVAVEALNSCRLSNEISSRSRRLRNHCEISN
jgi:hypothetical protein